MSTTNSNELSPDVLVRSIVNKIDKLHQDITNISSKFNHIKLRKKTNTEKAYSDTQSIEIANNIENNICNESIVLLEALFDNFHDFYFNHSDFVSKYFESHLSDLHKKVLTTRDSFNKYLNQPDRGQFNVFLSIMKTILSNCEILFTKAQELKSLDEAQQIEQARISSFNHIVDEDCYLADDGVNIELVEKQYYNDIRKLVNHICSQITHSNPTHTLGRLCELIRLLDKENVLLVGSANVFVNLGKYPGALDRCWEFLNHTVVTQAEIQFALNIETTVAFAGVIAAVLGHFPDRMDNMVAALKDRYSYLLQPNNGADYVNLEETCIQLKGIARFLAAISVAKPISGYKTHSALTPAFLWSLLASVCNEEMGPEFASEAAIGMLEIGGDVLKLVYGKQFEKLLLALKKKFVNVENLSSISLVIKINLILDGNSLDHGRDYIE